MTVIKPFKKDKVLIVGLGSIGEKYKYAAKKYYNYKNIFIYSKHKKKTNLRSLKKVDNLNYIILSNPSTERMNFFRSFIKKRATYIFEKPMASNALSERDNNEFLK